MPNRLSDATSPYLLQHADNPVDWWPWCDEAFEEARRRDVPVLLSVGYAACHWCHVMAHESFESESVAALLNRTFVAIKVDREERSDVDALYMAATQAMTGRGGWPMTVALDHDGAPFFAGTYFPPAPQPGMPSFTQLLQYLDDVWRNRRDDVDKAAAALREHLNAQRDAARPIADDDLDAAATKLLADVDQQNAGFGGAPKFPPSMVLEFLRLHHARTADPGSSLARERTLDAMARGGMYDQLGGGFARYSVDAQWVVPHFEKMLYDNALLLEQYARTDGDLAERVTRTTARFLLRELGTPGGALAASLDADSDGAEGTFYVWTPRQLVEALGEEDGEWAAELFGVTPDGTFEHGASTLQLRTDPDDAERFARVRDMLLAAREHRTRPARDDKVVTSWNALAARALVVAGLALDEPDWIEAARRIVGFLLEHHLVDGRLRRVSRDGVVGEPLALLDDHGALIDALAHVAAATDDPDLLERGQRLARTALDLFRDPEGTFHDTGHDAAALLARRCETTDNAEPCGLSALANGLLSLTALAYDPELEQSAHDALAATGQVAVAAPRFAGWALAAAERVVAGNPRTVLLPGPRAASLGRAAVRRLPGPLVVAGDDGCRLDPSLSSPETDGAALRICRGATCDAPVTSPADLAGR